MKHGLLTWSPGRHFLSLPASLSSASKAHLTLKPRRFVSASATTESVNEQNLSARERRQLRKERRESKPTYNWREEVEERLIQKPKKRYASWTEELNLDNLALLGPQWWVLRVPSVTAQEISERLDRSLHRNFPNMDFEVSVPAVQVKRKLKNGSYSVKQKPLFPGRVFLRSVLNKEIHDFIRECDGIRGFIASKVGNIKKQINKPKPISAEDMEAILQQAREEQEKADKAFEEEQKEERATLDPKNLNVVYIDSESTSKDVTESVIESKPKRRSRKTSQPAAGSAVRVVSGTFAEFAGVLRKMDRKTGRATVGFTLFGKETLVDLDASEIVLETK
ncbi:Transcription termination/antitermination protein like [Actinidia chinensis var. chinensis]|uniref:Transcription termination/antitermination protein like n=1 Tax=Actinidia chinensis var. chinensis TaxID=1590841 RepID=A0A2R6RRK1_ACTCC|nr:Transcription termination/antitermination protein like [Actinidia chinensis var. chinensis]